MMKKKLERKIRLSSQRKQCNRVKEGNILMGDRDQGRQIKCDNGRGYQILKTYSIILKKFTIKNKSKCLEFSSNTSDANQLQINSNL